MEGLLAGTVTLGLCKASWDLLSLPTVGASLNSACFCCGCLLIFTDLAVTAFLALLWLAEPWLQLFPVPNDVITLRFLLFLGHTYGAVLLLTILLIAMETACKLLLLPAGKRRADRGGRTRGGGSEGRRQGEGAETEGGRWSVAQGDAGAGERAEAVQWFSPIPGFLCSLLAWVLCGVWAGQRYLSEQLYAEACILRTASLSLCLPDLAAVTWSACSDPSLTLPAFILLLTLPLSLSVLRRRWTRRRANLRPRRPMPWAAIEKEALRAHAADVQACGSWAPPTPASPIAHSPCSAAELDKLGQSPKEICCGTVNTRALSDLGLQTVAASTCQAGRSTVLRVRFSRALLRPAGPQARTGSSCWTLGVGLLTGLLCAVALYLLPPSLAVNPILISSLGSLAERSLKH